MKDDYNAKPPMHVYNQEVLWYSKSLLTHVSLGPRSLTLLDDKWTQAGSLLVTDKDFK